MRSTRLAVFAVLTLAFVVWPFVAFAQEAAPAPAVVDAVAADAGFVLPMISDLIGHAKAGRYALAVVAGLILLSQLVLRFGSKIPGKVGEVLGGSWAKWLVPQVLSVLGAMLTLLATGAPFSLDVLIGAALLGLAGGGIGAKHAQIAAATQAGTSAATAVDTKADAVATLQNGPPKA